MKCAYCGTELKDGCLYCPECGKEAQVVPVFNTLEDEYLEGLLDDTSQRKPKNISANPSAAPAKRGSINKEREMKKKKKSQKNRVKILAITFLFLSIIAAIIGVGAKITIDQKNANSYDYQMSMAQQAAAQNEYDTAVSYYKNAIRLEKDTIAARKALADLYLAHKNYDSALVLYQEIVQLDAKNRDAYQGIILVYEAQGKRDEITKLSEEITDETILNLFAEYIVLPPDFGFKPGDYEMYLQLELKSENGCDIYYTLDKSDPIKNGIRYSAAIKLDHMGDYEIRAVCVNEKGIYSDVQIGKYSIDIPAPDMPTVTPSSGTYTVETPITVNVPDGCVAYYTWDGSVPSITSEPYIDSIAMPEGNNVLSVILMDLETEKFSKVYRGNFIYYPE